MTTPTLTLEELDGLERLLPSTHLFSVKDIRDLLSLARLASESQSRIAAIEKELEGEREKSAQARHGHHGTCRELELTRRKLDESEAAHAKTRVLFGGALLRLQELGEHSFDLGGEPPPPEVPLRGEGRCLHCGGYGGDGGQCPGNGLWEFPCEFCNGTGHATPASDRSPEMKPTDGGERALAALRFVNEHGGRVEVLLLQQDEFRDADARIIEELRRSRVPAPTDESE